jgi:hypothetical protein
MTGRGDHMDDEQFDRLLREAARGYNAPPPTPVEEMWAAIQAQGASPAAPASPTTDVPSAPVPRVVGTIQPRGFARAPRLWRASAAAIAALLLLSAGIAIGRRWGPAPAGGRSEVATRPDSTGRGANALPGAPAPHDVAGETAVVRRDVPADTPRAGTSRSRRSAPAEPDGRLAVVPTPESGATRGASEAAPYRALTAQHLAQAELLLSAFRAEALSDGGATADAVWARDLLSTTRLLLDSPAARDPERRRLLEDLELVLVQLASLPRADTAEERALIDRALRRGNVLTRLRSAGELQGT